VGANVRAARRSIRGSIRAEPSGLSERSDVGGQQGGAGGASFNLETLKLLKTAFDDADSDGSGALDEEEFIQAFQSVGSLSMYKSAQELGNLFRKIDANSDGTVDWDEFTNHILLEQSHQMTTEDSGETTLVKYVSPDELKDKSTTDKQRATDRLLRASGANPADLAAELKSQQHTDMISRLLWMPAVKGYVSAARDGHLKLWNDALSYQKTIRNGPGWISDMAAMPGQPLAVASIDRTITFYDTNRSSLDAVARVHNLENAPMCLEYVKVSDRDHLVFGDDKGSIIMYGMGDQLVSEGMGSAGGGIATGAKKLPGMSASSPYHLHSDWVTKIHMISESTSLNMISSAMDSTIKLVDMERKKVKWTITGHTRGVNTFDICHSFNFIASCGVERDILLWNPFTGRALGSLQGHTAPVQKVVVNEDDNQLISLSVDKVIKVWDVRTNKCFQTIVDKADYWPENRITEIMYSPAKKAIVAGAVRPKQWIRARRVQAVAREPVCAALFNPNFRQVVTSDTGGTINVHSLETGAQVFSFSDTHKGSTISSMCFDSTMRRLITAAQDGSCSMWNFNNGQCLKRIMGFGKSEISVVTYIVEGPNRFVAAAGWNREVCIWEDTSQFQEKVRHRMTGHTDDITCMCLCPITSFAVVLATGSYDGQLILWKLDGITKANLTPPDLDSLSQEARIIEEVLYLKHVHGSIVALRGDGVLHFWRLHDGVLLHVLDTQHEGDHVRKMCMNELGNALFTADSLGYIKAWEISEQPSSEGSERPAVASREKYCWRAHDTPLVSLEYINKGNLLLTAADAKTGGVRLWTAEGVKIGDFGEESAWDLKKPKTFAAREPVYVIRQNKQEVKEEEELAPDELDAEDDDAINDRLWLDQQKALIAQKGGRFRKKKALVFGDVLQRRLPIQPLATVEAPLFEKREDEEKTYGVEG